MKHALAVDGGNSKTDVAVVSSEGDVLGFARGAASSPHHIGVEGTVEIVAELIEEALGRPPEGRVADVAALLMAGVDFAAAADDAVAAQIVDRLASEVVALSRVALERLDLTEQPVELLLGGGLLQAGDGRLLDRIEAGMREVGSEIAVRRSSSPPIVGAVLLALDAISAPPEAQGRARDQVGQAAGGAERMPVG